MSDERRTSPMPVLARAPAEQGREQVERYPKLRRHARVEDAERGMLSVASYGLGDDRAPRRVFERLTLPRIDEVRH